MSEAKRIHEGSLPEAHDPLLLHDWPPAADGQSTCRRCGLTIREDDGTALLALGPCPGERDVISRYGVDSRHGVDSRFEPMGYPSGTHAWEPEKGDARLPLAERDTTMERIEALRAAVQSVGIDVDADADVVLATAERFLAWLLKGRPQ